MNEGELKKRMLRCGKDVWYADSESDNVINPQYLDADDTLKLVDAAKKDIYEPINRLESVNNPIAQDYVYTYQKILERLKKWFGESK